MALYSAESNRGWVSFKDAEWSECEVIESTEMKFTLKLKGGIKAVSRTECLFCYRNPSAVEGNADFLTLPNLDEPNILHSLRVRYWKEQVYSYTGPILIAVNPWKRIDIYNSVVMELHKAGKTQDPHIFGVASKALRELMSTQRNQCVLISGESGSGKTESTKYVLQVLTTSGEKAASKSGVEQQVMSTNPGSPTPRADKQSAMTLHRQHECKCSRAAPGIRPLSGQTWSNAVEAHSDPCRGGRCVCVRACLCVQSRHGDENLGAAVMLSSPCRCMA
jgi:hypothetical protein